MRNILAILLAVVCLFPTVVLAEPTVEEKIKELWEEIDYLSGRVDKNERHSTLDRIQWSGDLRTEAMSLHAIDGVVNPGALLSSQMSEAFGGIPAIGMDGNPLARPEKFDYDNDIMYTTRLRLGMNAKVYKNVNFAGRLLMFKNWGDSTGVQAFDGFNHVTMDGTNGGNPTGDWLRVERAYFDWKDIAGSNFYLSIGRRPSTYGTPTNFRENEMRGGTPSGHLVNFNFDGLTLGYRLGEITGIEGQVVRFCYGQGYESDWGNGTFDQPRSPIADVEDVHLGGFNIDALNDGTNFLQFTAFYALDITDGFKGLAAVPVPVPAFNNQQFPVVARLAASENIGDMILGGVGYAREEENGLKWFASLGWNHTKPNGKISDFGFGGLLTDAEIVNFADLDGNGTPETPVMEAASDDEKDGFSVYAGVQIPAPFGKLGLEYNWGSKYWFAFTQAQDDLLGSKLATRGHVGEAYYLFDINPNMFIKVGAIYYDYEYTGSGVPVGAPHKIEDVQNGKVPATFPTFDKAWDAYASLTVNF